MGHITVAQAIEILGLLFVMLFLWGIAKDDQEMLTEPYT